MGLILFFVVLPMIILLGAVGASKPLVPSNGVLVLDLRLPITDQEPTSAFASLKSQLSVVNIVKKLELAETDSNIKGIFVRAPEAGLAPAQAEEIRQALTDFKSSGKFVITHAQGFESPTLSNYVAIAPSNQIWLQNGSDFSATGIMSETTFLGGLFEKFGIVPQFEQFYEYKNAANVYNQKDYTPAHREATTSMLTGVYNAFLADIAVSRNLNIESLKANLDNAPLSPQQALSDKLIDKIGMPEDALDAAIAMANGNKDSAIDFADYAPIEKSGPTIALINAEGEILTGPDQKSAFSNSQQINSDKLTKAIRAATDNNDVKAMIIRVSSPGGSAIGSEQIWGAIERAKAKKKPVIVSMGSYAASGGYYMSAPADLIVAMPTTITGSIGVLGGKVSYNDALKKYTGANASDISVGGAYTTSLSASQPFTNSQLEAFHNSMARIYGDFTQKVANGRKLPLAKVLEIAKGRVWTGSQAKDIGLVDKIGGLRVAIEEAKNLAKIDKNQNISLKKYPEADDPLSSLAGALGGNTQSARMAAVYGLFLGDDRLNDILRKLEAANDNSIKAQEMIRVK